MRERAPLRLWQWVSGLGLLDLLWTYVLPVAGAAMTAALGFVEMPLMYIWVLIVFVLCVVPWGLFNFENYRLQRTAEFKIRHSVAGSFDSKTQTYGLSLWVTNLAHFPIDVQVQRFKTIVYGNALPDVEPIPRERLRTLYPGDEGTLIIEGPKIALPTDSVASAEVAIRYDRHNKRTLRYRDEGTYITTQEVDSKGISFFNKYFKRSILDNSGDRFS